MSKSNRPRGIYGALTAITAITAVAFAPHTAKADVSDMSPTELKVATAISQQTGADLNGMNVTQDGNVIKIDYRHRDDGRKLSDRKNLLEGSGFREVIDTTNNSAFAVNYKVGQDYGDPNGSSSFGTVKYTVTSANGDAGLQSKLGDEQGALVFPSTVKSSPSLTAEQKTSLALFPKPSAIQPLLGVCPQNRQFLIKPLVLTSDICF